jgi:uncharacterized coiled-coil protein SlyX
VPETPSPDAASAELRWLRARVAELEGRLAQREAQLEVAAAQLAARDAQLESVQAKLAVLAEQMEELRRRLGKDSSSSSKPPSSDGPYRKKPRDRSLRARSGRKPGRPKGQPGATLEMTGAPDEVVPHEPCRCAGCRKDLAGAPLARLT